MEEDCPFKRVEPHKNFITKWGTVYFRKLVEFKKYDVCQEGMMTIGL